MDGLAYRGVVTPDRSICSYVAKMDNLVDRHELALPAEAAGERQLPGKTKSLATLDEFVFFRHRYPRHDEGETALVFLSDATIRRWCGPQWRIATSRRTRDAAVVAEIQASQLDRLVAGKVEPGPLYTDLPMGDNGELTLTPQGVTLLDGRVAGLHDADRRDEHRAGDAGGSRRVPAMARAVPAELALGL